MKRLEACQKLEDLKRRYPLLGTSPKQKGVLGSIIFTVFMVLVIIPAGIELALLGLLKKVKIPDMPDIGGLFGDEFLDTLDPLVLILVGSGLALLAFVAIIVKFSVRKKKNKKRFDEWVEAYSAAIPDEVEREYNSLQKFSTTEGNCSDCIHCRKTQTFVYDGEDADAVWDCDLHGAIHERQSGKYYYLSCADCEWRV